MAARSRGVGGVPAPSLPTWRKCRDTALMDACIGGDQDAWSELVFRYARLVYSIPRRYGLGTEACEDVFQEVFSILVRQLPKIRRQTGLPKWLMTTTHRVSRLWFARHERRLEGLPTLLDSSEPPTSEMIQWEQQHLVRAALRELGGRCEELLTALYANQGPCSYHEVARQLGISVGSIGPTRSRCFAKLVGILERMEHDHD